MTTPLKIRCKVKNVIAHGERVYTLELLPESLPVPRFKSGQFLHLALDPYDPSGFWPESRVFSISSPPCELDKIKITYSVRGQFTARMEKEIVVGREVWIKLPYGEFFVDISHPIVLIAGGTGITAFTAFLNNLTEEPSYSITLFYGTRNRYLLVYDSLIRHCVQNLKGFKAFYFLERADNYAEKEFQGQISIKTAWQYIPEPLNSNFYISGPPPMLKTLSTQLQVMGVTSNSIHIDAWE
jgi:ferredoxin-NADP reductase